MLDQHECLKQVDIIGVGGVSDGAGMQRMMDAGATYVGVGTALDRIARTIANPPPNISSNGWAGVQRNKMPKAGVIGG